MKENDSYYTHTQTKQPNKQQQILIKRGKFPNKIKLNQSNTIFVLQKKNV